MSNWAKPGAKCVCIDDNWGILSCDGFSLPTRVPMKHEILTVSRTELSEDGSALMLAFEEIPERQQDGPISAIIVWAAHMFRPLVDERDDVAIFQRIADSVPHDPTVVEASLLS